MRFIVYCLTTLSAWILSQKLLSPSPPSKRCKQAAETTVIESEHEARRSMLSYLNPLVWLVYGWHLVQMNVLHITSYIYYACPLAWIAGLVVVLSRMMWNSWRWQSIMRKNLSTTLKSTEPGKDRADKHVSFR